LKLRYLQPASFYRNFCPESVLARSFGVEVSKTSTPAGGDEASGRDDGPSLAALTRTWRRGVLSIVESSIVGCGVDRNGKFERLRSSAIDSDGA